MPEAEKLPEEERGSSDESLYHELCAYTLGHGDPAFLHQHVVDAYAAQHAHESGKPIGPVFALVGLYLHVERGFTGRQVQRVHMQLGEDHRKWAMPPLPLERGAIGVRHVMAAAPGPERDAMIHRWCASVWSVFGDARNQIVELLRRELNFE
ncbi:MAG TPA: DUF5946 family protein [Terracidiphilus sp.]|nr:DUF5946 family protein [Terracidiphilus sp.]